MLDIFIVIDFRNDHGTAVGTKSFKKNKLILKLVKTVISLSDFFRRENETMPVVPENLSRCREQL